MKIGDLVTRKSYNNDIVFVITDIDLDNGIFYLKGHSIRLCADAYESDLKIYDNIVEDDFTERVKVNPLRNEYFYLPGKILHIDGDKDYLKKCLDYYEECNLKAIGIVEGEDIVQNKISTWLNEYNPSIVVITGHDAYYKKGTYKNSFNFISSVKEARKYEKSHDKLVIIAGACQSNYEELIRAGATFASSPKRVNIHALDPAIIAANMALSDIGRDVDLKKILENTKYGIDGMGGVQTKGTMYIGYPR